MSLSVSSDALLRQSAASLDDPPPDPPSFKPGEIVRLLRADHLNDAAQILCFDPLHSQYLAKLYPRLDYPLLRTQSTPSQRKLNEIKGRSYRPPIAAFDYNFFGSVGCSLEWCFLTVSDSQVQALSWDGDCYIGKFQYSKFSPEEVVRAMSLSPSEKQRFRGNVAPFETELLPGFRERMEAALSVTTAAVGGLPKGSKMGELPSQYVPVNAVVLEEEECRRRWGCGEPSFAQLHSRRRLLAVVDPVEMRQIMIEAMKCMEDYASGFADDRIERRNVGRFTGSLSKCKKAQLNTTEGVRTVQGVYFDEFLAIIEDIRKVEIDRMRDQERSPKIRIADLLLDPGETIDPCAFLSTQKPTRA
jgi:hypothetical protein